MALQTGRPGDVSASTGPEFRLAAVFCDHELYLGRPRVFVK